MTTKELQGLVDSGQYIEVEPGIYDRKDNRTNRELQSPKPKYYKEAALDKAIEGETACVGRIKLRIICCRQRPLDPDNIYGKDLIDGLRHFGLIPNDTPWDIALEYAQVKTTKAKEKTVIQITYP